MSKDPVYQWFMVECGAKPQGGFELCFRFDNYEEAMKKADELFKSGYGIINIYIRGMYGRESIPMSEWGKTDKIP